MRLQPAEVMGFQYFAGVPGTREVVGAWGHVEGGLCLWCRCRGSTRSRVVCNARNAYIIVIILRGVYD